MERKPFSLLTAGLVLSLAIFACSASARAALCGKCRDLMFVDSVGKCSDCGGPTSSGALQLCPKCSAKRHQCEHCRAALTEKDEAAEGKPADAAVKQPSTGWKGDAAQDQRSSGWTAPGNSNTDGKNPDSAGPAAKPEIPTPPETLPESKPPAELSLEPASPARLNPINPVKPGIYTSGKWRYQLQILSPGTRSEGRWGWLTYDGHKLPRGDVNDYYSTPWGAIYWVDVPTTAWGLHGWMPVPLPQNQRPGRALAFPPAPVTSTQSQPGSAANRLPLPASGAATPRARTLAINKSHNGQLARLHVGNMLVIRLPGNPTTGYQWQVAASNSPAVRLTVRPQYSPPAANSATALGTYTFIFQAVKPGTGSIRLNYVRSDYPGRPRDTFAVGINVSPVATARNADPMATGSRN